MKSNANGARLLRPDDGEVIEARGSRLVIKIASPSQLVCEYTAPANFPGPPLHVHPGFDETFMVRDGRLEVRIGDELADVTPGSTAYVSGTVPHTFRNPDSHPVRFLLVCSPGGFEHYFRALAAGDEEAIESISQRFGYRAVQQMG